MLRRFSATLAIALVSLLVLAGQALGREFRITTTDDLVRAAAGLALAAGPDAGQTPKPGDTLVVMSGSYNLGPNTVRVTLENLTIRSNEGSHATVLQGAGVVLSVEANGVTIGGLTANQGFKITGGSTCVKIQASDFVTIQNNLIASCGEGIILQGTSNSRGIVIANNEVKDNRSRGIVILSPGRRLEELNIVNNTVSGNGGYALAGQGNGIDIQAETVRILLVARNIVQDSMDHGVFLVGGRLVDARIENNVLQGNDRNRDTVGTGVAFSFSALDNVLIRDNEIRNNATGVSISGRITNVLINENNLANNTEWGVDARGVSSGLVDASNNWWGEPAGPYHPTENPYGVGNRVSDNVNFKPWLAVPARPTSANFQILSFTGPTRVAQGTAVQYIAEIKNIGVAEGAQEIKFTVSKKADGANIPIAVRFANMTISSQGLRTMTFNFTFTEAGTYTVEVSTQDDSKFIDVIVEPTLEQLVKIRVWTDKNVYRVGELVTIHYSLDEPFSTYLSITGPDGLPVDSGWANIDKQVGTYTYHPPYANLYPLGKRTVTLKGVIWQAGTKVREVETSTTFEIIEGEKAKLIGTISSPIGVPEPWIAFELTVTEILHQPSSILSKDDKIVVRALGYWPDAWRYFSEGDKVEVYGILAAREPNDYYVYVDTEYQGYVKKLTKSDLPDLAVTSISIIDLDGNMITQAKQGQPVKIIATIENQGNGIAKDVFYWVWVARQFDIPNNNDDASGEIVIGVTHGTLPEMAPGESTTIEGLWYATPVLNQYEGPIQAIVDPANEIEELNEDNNKKSASLDFYRLSDFNPYIHGYNFPNWSLSSEDVAYLAENMFHYLLACGINTPLGYFLKPILTIWMSLGGFCYGMAATSIIYRDHEYLKPVNKETFYMFKNEARGKIMDYHITQMVPTLILSLKYRKFVKNDVVAEFDKIKKAIDARKPIMILIARKNNEKNKDEFHAVVASSYYSLSDTEKIITVYDPNYPGMGFPVKFSLKTGKLEFILGERYDIWDIGIGEQPSLDICSELSDAIKKFLESLKGRKTVTFSSPVHVSFRDQYGRIVSDEGINNIPGAEVEVSHDMKVFYLPSDLSYDVNIKAYTDGTFTMAVALPKGGKVEVAAYKDIKIVSNSVARTKIDETFDNVYLDYDGDGRADKIIEPTMEEREPPVASVASVVAAHSGSPTLIEDADILWALQLWISGEEVPGTGGQTIDDTKMLELLHIWTSRRPISSASAQSRLIQTRRTESLTVREIKLSPNPVKSTRPATFRAEGSGIAGIKVEVFNLAGMKVSEEEASGNTLRFYALDDRSRSLANGVYLYVVTVRGSNGEAIRSEIRKLVILR